MSRGLSPRSTPSRRKWSLFAMPIVRRTLLTLILAPIGQAVLAHRVSADGRILLAADDATFSDVGFASAPSTAQFARNIATWFTCGQPGNFLVRSTNFGLTNSTLAATMTGAGHNWIVSPTAPDGTVADLLPYDAIFLSQTPINQATLSAYVQAGGNVYLAGASASDLNNWDTFLHAFGLDFGGNLAFGQLPVSNAHPLFLGVSSLYHQSGNDVIDFNPLSTSNKVLVSDGIRGVYGIFDGRGHIVVANDDWTLSNTGFSQSPSAAQFARNIANLFTDNQPGRFLVRSTNFALTESTLANTMMLAGHTWIINSTAPDASAADLLQYDAVFLCQTPTNLTTLSAYVHAGGSVYLAGGGGPNDASAWDPFLNPFGLDLGGISTLAGNTSISNPHPLFLGVSSLYHINGSDVNDLDSTDPTNQVLVSIGANGLYGISEASAACERQQAQLCVPAPQGMVGWWPLDEISGTTAHDIAGGHHGVFPMNPPRSVDGSVDSAIRFLGQSVSVPDDTELDFGPNADFSIDAWLGRPSFPGTSSGVVSKLMPNGAGYQLGISASFLPIWRPTLFLSDGVQSLEFLDTWGSMDNDWHHVAVTVDRDDPAGVKFYFDGQPTGTFNPTLLGAANLGNAASLSIGGQIDMDEVELFARVLAPSEVLALYNAGCGGKCHTPIIGTCDVLKNRSFSNDNTPGVMPAPGSVACWQRASGSPIVVSTTGCPDPGFIEMRGNLIIQDSIQQALDFYLVPGHRYRLSLCARKKPPQFITILWGITIQLNVDPVRVRARARNGAGVISTVGVTPYLSSEWTVITLPDWIANQSYHTISISAENGSFPIFNPTKLRGIAQIDNVCLMDLGP